MCGIVGYIGDRDATDFLLEGLRRLEYRGYDSAGIAILKGNDLDVRKSGGRIKNLADKLESSPLEGPAGIGHTRWATHGPATDENAHPHFGGDQIVAIVHNGVIESPVPNAAAAAAGVVSLPVHPYLTDAEVEQVAAGVRTAIAG